MTDFSLFVVMIEQSNLALLWKNFFRGEWTNRNFFSWVLLQQWTFLAIFFLLYWVAGKIDLKFKHTDRYYREHYQFESLHRRFNNIKNGIMKNGVYHRQSLAFKKNQLTSLNMIKIMYSLNAMWISLKQDLTYISWYFFPQKNYHSRLKYVLLMIKVQSLFFLVFIQYLSRIEGTLAGYLYSILTMVVFQVIILMFFKHTMLYRPNQVQEAEDKRLQATEKRILKPTAKQMETIKSK